MVKLEKTFLDRFINGAFLNKREIGRPIKYNIREKGKQGLVELVYNPRNRFEERVSGFLKALHPYLAFVTYRFHVEKARDIGLRVEDMYNQKFHKEPYIQFHVYQQYFHPATLHERVRNVNFHRRPRTLFKGFRVPDWATAEKTDGWELDTYSRKAWEQAMHETNSEHTPMQFFGERLEPNIINWFRWEQWGKGNSSRLFYNEVPKPFYWRYHGHFENPDKNLYSFVHGDQEPEFKFKGMDTTTPEGREQFKKEWNDACQLVPELISKEDMIYPHEVKFINEEFYFRRVWQHFREHIFKLRYSYLVNEGVISKDDAQLFMEFVELNHQPTFQTYLYARLGLRPDLERDPGFEATSRVMEQLGLSNIEIDRKSAQPYEEQFWDQFDVIQELSEELMRKELPSFVTDPSNKAKVEALMSGRKGEAIGYEKSQTFDIPTASPGIADQTSGRGPIEP